MASKGRQNKASNVKRNDTCIASENITDYEIQRIETMKSNARKMQAKGHGSLANSILKSKYLDVADRILDEGYSSDDDFQLDNNVIHGQSVPQREKVKAKKTKLKGSCSSQFRKPLSMPLSEPKVLRSHKVQKQSNGTSAVNTIAEIKRSTQPPPRNTVLETTTKQKKTLSSKSYCSPGSMDSYLKLRQQQQRSQSTNLGKQMESLQHQEFSEERQNAHDDDMEREASDDSMDAEEMRNISDSGSETEEENEMEANHESIEGPKTKRTRGPTVLAEIHAREPDERPSIFLNSLGVPIGPTEEDVAEFSRFLGTVARSHRLAPLNYKKWKHLPEGTFDNIWDYVQGRYIIPDQGKNHVKATVSHLWKLHKCRTKKKHYLAYETDEKRWEKRPDRMPEGYFRQLLDYWDLPETQKESQVNKANREQHEDVHTLGPKPLALLRHQMQQKDPSKQPPTQVQVYRESRKRKPDRKYKTDY